MFGYICLLCVQKLASIGGNSDSTSLEPYLQNPSTAINTTTHLHSCHLKVDSVRAYFNKTDGSQESTGALETGGGAGTCCV